MPAIEIPRRQRSGSKARPAYVREATDGGTERALVLTPRHSGERFRDAYDDYTESDLTQRQYREESEDSFVPKWEELERQAEEQAEAEARARHHVTFRDTPSLRSSRTNRAPSASHSQRSRSEYDVGGGRSEYSGGNGRGDGGWEGGGGGG